MKFQTALIISSRTMSRKKFGFYFIHHLLTVSLCVYVLKSGNFEGFGLMLLLFEFSTMTAALRLVFNSCYCFSLLNKIIKF